MARPTARIRANEGSAVARPGAERSTLNAPTSTTYPSPPTVRKDMTSAEATLLTSASGRHVMVLPTFVAVDLVRELAPPPGQHPQHRLTDDVAGHLGLAARAVPERDRHLLDPQAEPAGTPRVLDLEAVAVGLRADRPDLLERRTAEGLEPGRRVPDRDPEEDADVDVAAPGYGPTAQRPVAYSSAAHVAGPDGDVGVIQRGEEGGEPLGRVRQVSVHLHDRVVRPAQGPSEPGAVGGAEAFLLRTREQVDAVLECGVVGDPCSRAVGAAVVHDEHVDVRRLPQDGVQQGDDALGLVVGRDDND